MLLERLTSLSFFDGAGAEALLALQGHASLRTLKAGQLLFDRSDQTRDVYFVLSGRLVCVLWTHEGKELVFSRAVAGDHVGDLSAIDGQMRSVSVYAQTETEVLVIPGPDFMTLLDTVPAIRNRILRGLVAMVRRLTERSYHGTALSVEQRVRMHLFVLSLDCGGPTGPAELPDAPTHAEIANTIGANREAVSRALVQLRKLGLIDTGRKRLRILSPETLIEGIEL